jgi:hypothetical protein
MRITIGQHLKRVVSFLQDSPTPYRQAEPKCYDSPVSLNPISCHIWHGRYLMRHARVFMHVDKTV